jgi:hypothetical protein
VSMDGYKATMLNKALDKHLKRHGDNEHFVVIGHPKAFTPHSLKNLQSFVERNAHHHNFTTYTKEFNG